MNIFWWIVSFGILIGLFWLAKRAEPDLRSSADGEHFDVKFKDIPFGPESKQSAADTVRQMKGTAARRAHRRPRAGDRRPVREGQPLQRAAADHRPEPEPPRKTTVYVAGEGSTYVAVAVGRNSPADERLAALIQ
jgi:hypothetical protein